VAAQLERRFIHCDRSPIAHEIARGRLLDAGAAFESFGVVAAEEIAAGEAQGEAIDVRLDTQAHELELRGVRVAADTRQALLDAGVGDVPVDATLDLVQAWCVAWRSGEPMAVDDAAHRTLHRRQLDVRFAVPPDARAACVRVYDVLGRIYTRELRW